MRTFDKPTAKELARHQKWQKHIDINYYHRRDWEDSDDYHIWEDGGNPPKDKRGVESVDIFG